MTGKQLLLKALKERGVKYIFGYTGGAIMPVFDEMEKIEDFKFVMSRHEQGRLSCAKGFREHRCQLLSRRLVSVCRHLVLVR